MATTIFDTPVGNELSALNDSLANKSKINYVDQEVTTNVNGLFYPALPSGAIVLNLFNIDVATYIVTSFGNGSYAAFNGSNGQWVRLASTTFNVRIVYWDTNS